MVAGGVARGVGAGRMVPPAGPGCQAPAKPGAAKPGAVVEAPFWRQISYLFWRLPLASSRDETPPPAWGGGPGEAVEWCSAQWRATSCAPATVAWAPQPIDHGRPMRGAAIEGWQSIAPSAIDWWEEIEIFHPHFPPLCHTSIVELRLARTATGGPRARSVRSFKTGRTKWHVTCRLCRANFWWSTG
jgi:hypothetical protein